MFKHQIVLLLVSISLFSLSFAFATESVSLDQMNATTDLMSLDDPNYLAIDTVEIIEVPQDTYEKQLNSTGNKGLGEVILAVDNLIALGKKIWAIVEAGRPVVNANFSSVSVLPNLADPSSAFLNMANWSIPKTQKYEVVMKNLYGMEMVRFSFMIMFQHDGTYENKGKYLTGINVIPNNITVGWGYQFDCKSELLAISNAGTAEDPIAAATIKLEYVTKTALQETRNNVMFHVMGDGRIIQL
jgi:hypothetical protein